MGEAIGRHCANSRGGIVGGRRCLFCGIWRAAYAGLFRKEEVERDMDEELRIHSEARIDDLVRSGVEPAEAARRATIEFGGIEQVKEDCRDIRGRWLEDLIKDVRYAARGLRRSPGLKKWVR